MPFIFSTAIIHFYSRSLNTYAYDNSMCIIVIYCNAISFWRWHVNDKMDMIIFSIQLHNSSLFIVLKYCNTRLQTDATQVAALSYTSHSSVWLPMALWWFPGPLRTLLNGLQFQSSITYTIVVLSYTGHVSSPQICFYRFMHLLPKLICMF